MIYRIEIWSRLTGAALPVGEMICEIGETGRGRGSFRYDRQFLERGDAFALDPVSLPLGPETFSVEHPGIFGVFEDSLPDDWGRRLLIRKHNLSRNRQNLPSLLLALGSSGLGALSYSEGGKPGDPPNDTSTMHLSALVQAAEQFERGEIRDPMLSLLLGAGSSPGGARPKSLVFDEKCGVHYIAKFPSIRDQVDVVRIEAGTMALAARAGLKIPPTKLVPCGGRVALLVERFDVTPRGRRHMISLQTLLKAHGYYQCRYLDILNIVRKYSAAPLEDSEELFRQMVFNAVIGNTDDHLKNFWMIHDHLAGWRLSPSFDLLPDVGRNGEHVLFFDLGGYYPGRMTLEKLGRSWGIRRADRVVEEVYGALSVWKDVFSVAGVPDEEIAGFSEIDTRLEER